MSDADAIENIQKALEEALKRIATETGNIIEIERLEEFKNFRLSLMQESDRGSVLMAAAFIDDKIGQLIQAFLVDNNKIQKKTFTGNGSLATFSSRIDMAYLLGLIPENILNDLHKLRRLRNDFSHNAAAITFTTESVRDRTNSFEVLNKSELSNDTRAYFLRSMTTILACINIKMESFERCKADSDFDVTQLNFTIN